MLEQPLDFTGYSSIQFFSLLHFLIYLHFPNTVSEALLGTLKRLILKEIPFQSCSLKNYIFKIIFSKNINFITLIYTSSESSGELSKSSIICLTTFSQYIYILLKTLADNNCQLSEIYFGFQKILSKTGLLSNSFLISALPLFQIILYFSDKSSSSIKKYIIYFVHNNLYKRLF